jgi:hypothetical protein
LFSAGNLPDSHLAYIQVFAYSQVRGAVWCRIDFDGQWRRITSRSFMGAIYLALQRSARRAKRTVFFRPNAGQSFA